MNAKNLDLNDLRLLMLVMEHGGFSAAAKAIGMANTKSR